MSEPNVLYKVAELLRPVSRDVFNGKGKLCLSTVYLQKLNSTFEEHNPEQLVSSFHPTDTKFNSQRDLQFLLDLIKGTVSLKLTPDLLNNEGSNVVNLRRFGNLKALEIHKLDVKMIVGVQKLRPQVQELICVHNLEYLRDILEKCGGDLSQGNLWNELRKANFSHNRLIDIDNSLEWTPWLTTLDLSHNEITNIDFLNVLPNLKYLNVSFNKLSSVPKFRGQICKRLQVLILSNNFIENLIGLVTVTTIIQLDLSQNCIMDHNTLLYVAHMASLSLLNLQGNPIYFHPHHRNTTSQYLNKNTRTVKFSLDNVALNKQEKSFAGSHYPITQNSLGSSNNSSLNSLENSLHDKQKRVRNVTIQEGHMHVVETKKTPVSTPKTSTVHLEMKKQVEQLRQEYGDSWLYRHSGIIFQDVLGFEKSTVLSSTPSEANPSELYFEKNNGLGENKSESLFETAKEEQTTEIDAKEEFVTAEDNDDFFSSVIESEPEKECISDDDDACEGEMFYAFSEPNGTEWDLCLIVTETHLSERDSVSVKEQARWNLNIVKSCQKGSTANEIVLIFDTVRKDRQSRVYYIEENDKFISLVQSSIKEIPEIEIKCECMKCNQFFSITKKNKRETDTNVQCPKCKSAHVIVK